MKRIYIDTPYETSVVTDAVEALSKGGEVWVSPRDMLFHYEGGGQPSDRGYIIFQGKRHEIVGLAREKGKIFARVVMSQDEASEALWLLKSGELFTCEIDWPYRFRAMRCHTAAHVVMGALKRRLQNYMPKGMQISEDLARVELRYTGDAPTPEFIDQIERDVNAFLHSGAAVTTEKFPSLDAAREARPDHFRADGELSIRGDVRMLWIENWDHNPCGGSHVADVKEIGAISMQSETVVKDQINAVTFSVVG